MSGASFDLRRQLVAETIGTALLLAAVVGSGIMAERLAGGSVGLALLCNTIPTGAILVVIVLMFGPVSGGIAAAFVGVQIVGGLPAPGPRI